MVKHSDVWKAVDMLAKRHGLSPSGLARRAGLDPTTFNPSKRASVDGRERWPSTESVAKALEAVGDTFDSFAGFMRGDVTYGRRSIPLIGMAQAGVGGFFSDGGFPVGHGWDAVHFPGIEDEHAYALEVSGDSMLPAYRDGDVLIVSPASQVRRGDRVVLKTVDGQVMAKELKRRTAQVVELRSLNPEHPDLVFDMEQVTWIARILWASQ
jgi:phage repressor protein C with HTH and peptisase S24 domain